jgi:hypothetical protein
MNFTELKHETLMTALNSYPVSEGRNFRFEEKIDIFAPEQSFVLGINWSAIGTATPADAKGFATRLAAAADFARRVNALNLTYTRTHRDFTDDEKTLYFTYVGVLTNLAEEDDYDFIINWILNAEC